MMRKRLAAAVALVLLAAPALADTAAPPPPPTRSPRGGAFPMQGGEAIFKGVCQGCHMPDAKGATGAGTYPALTGNPRLASAQYMAATILFGRHDMPSFKTSATPNHSFFEDAKLSDAQIAEVINYIRTHFGNHYSDSITAAQVTAMHPQDNPSNSTP